MYKKLNLAIDVIDAMLEWFNQRHIGLDTDILIKLGNFLSCEVKENENKYVQS